MSSADCNGDAAVYVLGALEDDEVSAFEEHVSSCAVCRDEMLSMQVVVDLLPATVPALAAPAELKRRVMAEAADEQQRDRSSASRLGASIRRWRPLPAFGALTAAAAAAFVLLVVAPLGGRSTHGAPANPGRVIAAQVSIEGSTGRAALHESGSRNELVVSRMPPPPARHIYQVWLSRPGQSEPAPTNALFNVAGDGSATVDVPGSLRGVKAVLVTTEPLGGSRVPSSEPVITASLS
ncbi:MAG: anti-sigma factor domain-containing protein [Solirubrobacteraceae bacterium]